MKSVLISIRPEWCKKIASGEKTIEIRRTRPKIERPFICYIYCTKEKPIFIARENNIFGYFERQPIINGKVIGEFVCDEVINFLFDQLTPLGLKHTCLNESELNSYLKSKTGYGWHISNLKIYDKPKGLEEFEHYCKKERQAASELCKGCKYCFKGTTSGDIYCDRTVLTAPQSWCYVEEL